VAQTESPVLGPERRTYARHPASRLRISETQIRDLGGRSRVSIVDLSTSGGLFETDTFLRPDTETVVRLATATTSCAMPLRVVRSYLFQFRGRPVYRSACVFHYPLELVNFVEGCCPTAPGQLHVELKRLLQPSLQASGPDLSREADTLRPLAIAEAATLVESFRQACRRQAPDRAAHHVDGLLASVTLPLLCRADSGEVRSLVEDRLRQALPALVARFEDSPQDILATDAEYIYFQVPCRVGGASPVLSVGLSPESGLEDWQFRLLRASAYVAALLCAVSKDAEQRPCVDRRRRPRVTGPFDGRWIAGSEMPILIADLSEAGCLVSSFEGAEPGRLLTLEIRLPGEGALILSAETVAARADFGFAASFIDTPASAVANLRSFVERRPDALPGNS
jgi:hypothetical protein